MNKSEYLQEAMLSKVCIEYFSPALRKHNLYAFDLDFFLPFQCLLYRVPSHIFSAAIHENESVYHGCFEFSSFSYWFISFKKLCTFV